MKFSNLEKFNKFDFNDPKNLIALDFVSYDEFIAFYTYVDYLFEGRSLDGDRWITIGLVRGEFWTYRLAMSYWGALELAKVHRPFESGFPTEEVYHTLEGLRPEALKILKSKIENNSVVWINKGGYLCGFSLGEEHFRFTDVL